MAQKVIVIVGPTASGKSALGISLARKFGGEIISADSRQVYRGLDIGSGKVTKREMCGVRHYLLDVTSPRSRYSVARYKKESEKAIGQIMRKNKVPIIVGGTGQYVDALIFNKTVPEVPPNFALRKKLEKFSIEKLFLMLKKLDPRRAREIDRHNPRRLIRAIEIAFALGHIPPSTTLRASPYEILWIGLTLPAEELCRRIRSRLLSRLKIGMIAEVKNLRGRGLSWKRLESFGLEYRYISLYLQKKLNKQAMIGKLQTEIYRYAKRQMTWFKRNQKISWYHPSKPRKIARLVGNFLNP